MPSFVGIKNSNVEVTVSDRDEVQICPKCTFPNYSSARQCLDCGHPLLGSNIRWLRANMVGKCNNPTCGSFVCVKDSKCKR